jgi:hypothetical protein
LYLPTDSVELLRRKCLGIQNGLEAEERLQRLAEIHIRVVGRKSGLCSAD